ncbi:MAG TPA: peptidylprolyl isomerase [Bryobacteraceae bacterium]|jgi:parvulin-like peptidyl-prolyl isomerase|nr:peptidylprolyl isomerase [Bryobacteraceae bacterium]
MKPIVAFLFCLTSALWAQAPAPLTPETVVAEVGGKPVTAGELMLIIRMSPPEAQKNMLKDGKVFLESYGLIRKLSEMAEKAHLDQQSPIKEQLEISRRQMLASAQAGAARDGIIIRAEEQKKFYEEHRDQYTQAKVKVLYISFRANPAPQTDPKAKKILTEAEAKAKAEKLLAQIRSDGDFVKLVKENSDDAESLARDGDFGPPIAQSDKNIPANIKSAIFALKTGQVSDPIRTASGYYLFRLEEIGTQPYEAVRDDIYIEIQSKRFEEWREQMQKGLNIKILNEDFFSKTAASLTGGK